MLEIAIGAKVICSDGEAGIASHVIINPVSRKVTHFVVQSEEVMGAENWLVPFDMVAETGHERIHLACTLEELHSLPAFSEMHWIQADREEPGYEADAVYLAPYVTPMRTDFVPVETESVPVGELAIMRGAFVEAADGLVGTVGELLLDPESGEVTHVVLQEGHLWGKKEIAIPLAAVDETQESAIYLKLTREQVESLPGIPVKRHHDREGESRELELVTKLFETQDEASAALKQIKKRKDIRIRNAAVVIKNAEGKVSIKETADLDAKRGGLVGALAGGLIGLVGGPVGVVVGALVGAGAGGIAANQIDAGFSNSFLEKYQEYLNPGSSALIVLAEGRTGQDLADALSEFQGITLRHALTDKMVDQMIQAAADADSSEAESEESSDD